MSRVSSFGHQRLMLNNMLQNQSKLFIDEEQIASGKKASDYKGYSGELTTLLGAKNAFTRVQDYTAVTKQVKQVLDTNDLYVENIYEEMTNLRQTVLEALSADRSYAFGSVLDETFSSVAGALNSSIGGVYTFAGSKTDVLPVSGTSLSDLIAATSATDLFTNNNDYASAKLDKNITLTYGLGADEVAAESFEAMKNLADFDAGPGGPISGELTAAQTTFLEGELATIDAALANLQVIIARNGTKQETVDRQLEDHVIQSDFLEIFVSDIEDVDVAEAIMNLNNDQTALEASYQVAAQLQSLSLLNYL